MTLLVDSHCHLDFPDLAQQTDRILGSMKEAGVGWALIAGVTLERFATVRGLAEAHANLFAAVGVHPDSEGDDQVPKVGVTADELVALADHPKVVAIGETGLDYYRLTGDLEWQRERFRQHIEASRRTGKPLIIHTRSSAADTLAILKEAGTGPKAGVLHCFTETIDVARQALDLGFYISISGIVTFKNAAELREVAKFVPLDRLLVETDSPYLAPVPYRGKTNEPTYVRHVAECIATERGLPYEAVAAATTRNFFELFSHARPE
jgi:TatD DNase family protein